MSAPLQLFLLLIFLAGSGFFSGMETGMVSINRLRLQHLLRRNSRSAHVIAAFLARPDHLLGTALIGTNLCNIAFTVLTTSLLLAWAGEFGVWFSGVVSTALILVFGEYIPKAWFQSNPIKRTRKLAYVLRFFGVLFAPINLLLSRLVRLLIPDGGESAEHGTGAVSREDLQFLFTRESGATPSLSKQKRDMIESVFSLSGKTCRDIMIPRDRMIVIRKQTPREEILAIARARQVESLPVYSEEEGRFHGVLNILDLLFLAEDGDTDLTRIIRPPQYVPEDMPADDLIPRMRLARQPMLLVRDKGGAVTGFVTIEVVLEEIVGPL